MTDVRSLLSQLHDRIGTSDDPDVDVLVTRLRRLAGDPTAGDDTNALVHQLYEGLGGQPNHGHALCPSCSHPEALVDRPPVHSHAHVLCRDGTSTGMWHLDCTHENGSTFSVTGSSYDGALRTALDAIQAES